MDQDEEPSTAPRPRRRHTLLRGLLYREDSPCAIDIRIRNLSSGGLMANCPETLARGERVSVSIREIGDVAGQVVWDGPDGIGIAFDAVINPERALHPTKAPATPRLIPGVTSGRRPGLRVR